MNRYAITMYEPSSERVAALGAAIPIAVSDAVHEGVISQPARIFTPAFGAGAVAGYVVMRIDPRPLAAAEHGSGAHPTRMCRPRSAAAACSHVGTRRDGSHGASQAAGGAGRGFLNFRIT